MKLGICLSGGGMRGLSHIGALKALREHDICPDIVSGTSAGSIIAGLYATGMSLDDIEKFAIDNADFIDVNYIGIMGGLLNLLFRKKLTIDGFIRGDKIENVIRKQTSGINISDTKVPVIIVAADIDCGKTVYFSSTKLDLGDENAIQVNHIPVAEAVRASLAIPGVFSPKKIMTTDTGYTLVDGGVKNNLPFDVLLGAGADKVIGFNLGYNGVRTKSIDNVMEIASQSIDILTYNAVELRKRQHNISEYRKDGKVYEGDNSKVLLLNPQIWDIPLLDTGRAKEAVERGYNFVKDNIEVVRNFIADGNTNVR